MSKLLIEKRNVLLKSILSKEEIPYGLNRSSQVEGVFGVLKHDYGFKRFLTWGRINAIIKLLLLTVGYDINKLHSKIQRKSSGTICIN